MLAGSCIEVTHPDPRRAPRSWSCAITTGCCCCCCCDFASAQRLYFFFFYVAIYRECAWALVYFVYFNETDIFRRDITRLRSVLGSIYPHLTLMLTFFYTSVLQTGRCNFYGNPVSTATFRLSPYVLKYVSVSLFPSRNYKKEHTATFPPLKKKKYSGAWIFIDVWLMSSPGTLH